MHPPLPLSLPEPRTRSRCADQALPRSSGPSQTYPQRAYRNPLDRLVAFLDSKHGKNWAIWEFRAEGTGYPDDLVYNRIRHYPWPDHHPPPFRLVPMIMASMRNWVNGNDLEADGVGGPDEGKNLLGKVLEAWKDKKSPRVIVVHCKAGKGRSGTMACSFLISECGWTPEEALARFTERRMRPKFGPGVSIPSQLRWISYVDRWTKGGKIYVDRELEILEIHVWGLRHGVKVAVEGFVEEGKKIKVFHTFKKEERVVVEGGAPGGSSFMDTLYDMAYGSPTTEQGEPLNVAEGSGEQKSPTSAVDKADSPVADTPTSTTNKLTKRYTKLISPVSSKSPISSKSSSKPSRSKSVRDKLRKEKNKSSESIISTTSSLSKTDSNPEPGGQAVIFKPRDTIRLPTSDVNITMERRNRAPSSMGLTMVTAVAHVWFNAFFEGNGPEQGGKPDESGVFQIDWDKLDGIKGSSQKGTRALEHISVVWRFAEQKGETVIPEPGSAEPVPQMQPADWKGGNEEDPGREKKLGLRVQSPDSANPSTTVSQASSIKDEELTNLVGHDSESDSLKAVKSDFPGAATDSEDDDKRGRTTQSDDARLEAYAEKLPSPNGSSGKSNK